MSYRTASLGPRLRKPSTGLLAAVGDGEAGPGEEGADLFSRVRTHWPCSNCTRAQTSIASATPGITTRAISRFSSAASVPSFQARVEVFSVGSGVARTNFALAGSAARTTTWWAVALDVF